MLRIMLRTMTVQARFVNVSNMGDERKQNRIPVSEINF